MCVILSGGMYRALDGSLCKVELAIDVGDHYCPATNYTHTHEMYRFCRNTWQQRVRNGHPGMVPHLALGISTASPTLRW